MPIDKPKHPRPYPDREIDCQMAMEDRIRDVMDEAHAVGWSDEEVVAAVIELARNWRLAMLANAETGAQIAQAKGLKPN